jgi:hypothetical protein
MTRLVRSAVVCAALLSSIAFAAGPKSYQVTGEVTEVRDDVVVVTKGKEKFEIAKGAVATEVKVGQKVKVDYTMTATAIEVKDAKK